MKRWPTKPLGEVCTINPKFTASDAPAADAEVTFVSMAAVDEMHGNIARTELRQYKQVAKGYTSFRENDVLFAKITPCMQNGKAAVARGLRGGRGFGSTEFYVLRPSDRLMPEWVFALIRQPSFRSAAEASFTGTAGQQRVPVDFLKTFAIPVPPLPVQERIVKLLDEADALRNLRAEADRRTAHFIPALFHEMFGDPEGNAKGFARVKVKDAVALINGRAFKPTEWSKTGLPIIRIQNLKDSTASFNLYDGELEPKHRVKKGALLIAWAGQLVSFGVHIWDGPEGVLNQHIFKVEPRLEYEIHFLQHALSHVVEYAKLKFQGSEMKHLTRGTLNEAEVLFPPLPLQQEFAQRVTEIRELESDQAASRRRLDDLFQSMLHRAFNGRL